MPANHLTLVFRRAERTPLGGGSHATRRGCMGLRRTSADGAKVLRHERSRGKGADQRRAVLPARDLFVLLAAGTPLLLLPSGVPYFWTDTTEIGERRLIARSWPALCDAVVHGIDG